MIFVEVARVALASLRDHRLRTFLNLLGIIIAVTTIILVIAVVSGLNRFAANLIGQLGPNTFIVSKGSGAVRTAATTTTLQQGVLEASDVDAGTAMTDMIEAQRAYQMASKAIQTQDQILEIANGVKR